MSTQKISTRAILFVLLFSPLFIIAQDQKKDGLLWRISGKGLSTPSYLYGTMHTGDKRVFNFGDSLYSAFESCAGFAIELNPDSMMLGLMNENDSSVKVLLKDVLSAKTFARVSKKLQETFKKEPEQVTEKEFRGYFHNWQNYIEAQSPMSTFMDAYLYNVAHRQGKWTGGIEDLADQQGIAEKMGSLDDMVKELLNDNRKGRQMMNEMIRLYVAGDLDEFNAAYDKTGKVTNDTMMIRRNRKMSYRIDSLAQVRKTFFAIGAGHLSGRESVVSLLRSRGYTVTRVMSSKRVHVQDYSFKGMADLPWVAVQSDMGLYSAEMPGAPQKNEMESGRMDTKLHADIGTGLLYFTMGFVGAENTNADSMMDRIAKNMSDDATISDVKKIEKGGFNGKELVTFQDNRFSRMQVFYQAPMVYMAMVGAPVREALHTADADRFFRSFVMYKSNVTGTPSWKQLTNSQYGFTLAFPATPALKRIPAEVPGAMHTNTFYASDTVSGGYFQCSVREVQKGYFLKGDTALFEEYVSDLQKERGAFQMDANFVDGFNYPAIRTAFYIVHEGDTFFLRTLQIHRGSRIYTVLSTVNKSQQELPMIDSFFNSFAFVPIQESNWSWQSAPDKNFRAWAPATFDLDRDTTSEPDEFNYQSLDAPAVVTFYVTVAPYAPGFWALSDTALLHDEVLRNVNEKDSLLSFKPVVNGKYKGVEALVRLGDNHNLRKMRLFLQGDTLVSVYAIAPPEFLEKENARRFFDEFTFLHEPVHGNLFTNKAPQLIEALQSGDSATVAKAINILKNVEFVKADLPLLHPALIYRYNDSIHKYDIAWELMAHVARMKDITTMQFIENAYNLLPADKEDLKYDLLYPFAYAKTSESFSLIRKLLVQHVPATGSNYQLFQKMNDTLALTATIFPDLFPLLVNDPLSGDEAVSLMERLLENNLLDKKILVDNGAKLYDRARTLINTLHTAREPEGVYKNHALIRLLGRINNAEANSVLKLFLSQPNEHLAYTALIQLLKNGQPVPPSALTKVAADKYYRLDLYNDLRKYKKSALFPKQYLTQQSIAESEVYILAREEYSVDKMTRVAERLISYKGKKQKFYLYKLALTGEDTTLIRLGIAGPFAIAPAAIKTDLPETGIYWSKEFNEATINKDLEEYLASFNEEAEQP